VSRWNPHSGTREAAFVRIALAPVLLFAVPTLQLGALLFGAPSPYVIAPVAGTLGVLWVFVVDTVRLLGRTSVPRRPLYWLLVVLTLGSWAAYRAWVRSAGIPS
jgi:hypothetical protein